MDKGITKTATNISAQASETINEFVTVWSDFVVMTARTTNRLPTIVVRSIRMRAVKTRRLFGSCSLLHGDGTSDVVACCWVLRFICDAIGVTKSPSCTSENTNSCPNFTSEPITSSISMLFEFRRLFTDVFYYSFRSFFVAIFNKKNSKGSVSK